MRNSQINAKETVHEPREYDCKEDIESMLTIRMTERGVNKDVRPSLAISSGDIQFTMLGNTLE